MLRQPLVSGSLHLLSVLLDQQVSGVSDTRKEFGVVFCDGEIVCRAGGVRRLMFVLLLVWLAT